MLVRYASGVRVGALTIDPTERVVDALWTHRPARRSPCSRCLASAGTARLWPSTLGIPIGAGAVAMGFRIELLPTGYGPGGAAVLLTRGGRRTLVVGPTTEMLEARHADRLVLFAPAAPTGWDWTPDPEWSGALIVPDGAAAEVVCERLDAAGLPHRRPRWLARGSGPADASIRVATHGVGRPIDARPQVTESWLAAFAKRVAPRTVYVHGRRADHMARRLAADGWPVRVLHDPQQLSFFGDEPYVPAPRGYTDRETTDGPETR